MDIFHSDLDRILFLSMLAEACLRYGAVCHAWCLMTTHFHLVLEDTRGVLSQLMHRVGSAYARYFNDTRPGRRAGPLFESRFRAEIIDTTDYFEDACAYVLLNPLQTKVPMASSAETYRWSSAALVCSDLTPAASATRLLEPLGGVEAILSALPRPARQSGHALRRSRLEAFASGTWLERDHLLAGRSPEQYRRMLAERAKRKAAGETAAEPPIPPAETRAAHRLGLASRSAFAGFTLGDVLDEVRAACDRLIPSSLVPRVRTRELVVYALHRFTSAPTAAIAKIVSMTEDTAQLALERLRAGRALDLAWQRLFWALEWALRWRLRAAPHRP